VGKPVAIFHNSSFSKVKKQNKIHARGFPGVVGEFYGTFVDIYESLVELYGTFVDIYRTLVELYGTLVDIYGSLVELYETSVDIYGSLVELYKTSVEHSGKREAGFAAAGQRPLIPSAARQPLVMPRLDDRRGACSQERGSGTNTRPADAPFHSSWMLK
jgi:hypothetical protein